MSNDLDRLMAERVMGWHQEGEHWYGTEEIKGITVTSLPLISLWHPTSDIAQAMMCATKLKEKKIHLNLQSSSTGGWTAGFISDSGWATGPYHCDGNALAICKAIEKALEAK